MQKEINFTIEALTVVWQMIKNPDRIWERKNQYRPDAVGRREIAAIDKWLLKYGYPNDLVPMDSKEAESLAKRLHAYYKSDAEKTKEERLIEEKIPVEKIWPSFQNLFTREADPGVKKIEERFVKRLQDMLKHYDGKDIKDDAPSLITGFCDLEDALAGNAIPSADEVCGEAEKKEDTPQAAAAS